jgi:uncharacterized surface protein with fasciclin (FAS1) repeats
MPMYKPTSLSRTGKQCSRACCLVAVAGAMVALAPSVSHAQAFQSTTTTTTISSTSYPVIVPTIAPAPTGPNGQPIDFSVLINSPFNYVELRQAHDSGFSNSEVAAIAKISIKTGVPFDDIKEQALAGNTFPTLAQKYNLRLRDVWDTSDYQDKIAAYKLAYENSGAGAFRNMVAASQQEMINGAYAPASDDNLAAIVNSSPDLTMFARAIRTAHMDRDMRRDGPLTVFAPTDAAFARLSTDQLNALMSDRRALAQVIRFCIVPRRIDSASALAMTSPAMTPSLTGDQLTFTSVGSTLMVDGATVVKPDVFASNGVLHEIDTVLMPPGTTMSTTTTTTNNTTLAPSTTVTPSTLTQVAPNGTTTTTTPNGTTTVEPNGNTIVSPATPNGSTIVTPNNNGSTTVTPAP